MLRLFEPVFYVIGLRSIRIWILHFFKEKHEEDIQNWSILTAEPRHSMEGDWNDIKDEIAETEEN